VRASRCEMDVGRTLGQQRVDGRSGCVQKLRQMRAGVNSSVSRSQPEATTTLRETAKTRLARSSASSQGDQGGWAEDRNMSDEGNSNVSSADRQRQT